MSISALIVNWNTRDDLNRCLTSLKDASALSEVIVVDNDSVDGSADMVRARHPGVCLLAEDRNLGYAAGNNRAAERAAGDFLLFLNPDTVVPKDAPRALAAFLNGKPRAALAAPRLVNPDGSTQPSVRGMPEPAALLGAWTHLDRLAPGHPAWGAYRLRRFDYSLTQRAPQPMASAWMVRRAAWADVGPFDEAFPLFFNDVDWCLRAQRAGWETWYVADVSVVHRRGASTRQVKPGATWESHRALAAFYQKHYRRRLGPVRLALAKAAILGLGGFRAAWYAAWPRR